jgi:K+ transporter
MTNKQRALLETAKVVVISILMGITFSTLIATGYGIYVGGAMLVLGMVYALIMIYEMKLARIEAAQRLEQI